MSGYELQELEDVQRVVAALRSGGVGEEAAVAKGPLFARAAAALRQAGLSPGDRARAFFVPGRIEVLGKHTDYGGGSSIVTAVEQGFCLVAVPRPDATARVHALDLGEDVCFGLEPELSVPHGHWSNYPLTAARRLARNFPECRRGMDLAFASDLPPAAGMSSSSALIVASFLVIAAVNDLAATDRYRSQIGDALDLASYLGCVENGQSFGELAGDRGVGTFGGSEDHTAILCSEPRALGQFAYCPTRFERRIPVPPNTALAVGVSGAVAEKTGAAQELYNRASGRASALVSIWQQHTGGAQKHLAPILGSAPDAGDRLRQLVARSPGDEFTAQELATRLDHFIAESELIPQAGDALAAGDLDRFGQLVDRSQELTESLLQNQIPETVSLARSARSCGARAASAFGAGFGGSVWSLVDVDECPAFLEAWESDYTAEFPERGDAASFFQTQAGPAAFELSDSAIGA